MVQTLVFLPLIGAIIAGLWGRALGVRICQLVTTGSVIVSAVLSWIVFIAMIAGRMAPEDHTLLNWIHSGALSIDWALRVDMLTAVMLVVVNTVSAIVHVYSIGYMAEDAHRQRFFSYLSLFTFAMLMLVTSNNLVQMFFGWEGVGLASYLLIGFWYEKPSANAAALKAFVVNRVGDFGFSLGIFALALVAHSVNFDEIFASAPVIAGKNFSFLGVSVPVMSTICLLLFVGAMGKSAQLGLHTWLPDAMEGPTPVSALIHAATMVTAGVFMLVRCSPIFEYAPAALDIVCVVGALTAFFAATVATTQFDIKRVIAYSTCSQLGYMFFAIGVGAYGAAMFHLFTHAFFKALLFLCAGSVIHAMHHEQDMRYYGGLRTKIPLTFLLMMIGTLAITGVPFLSGYYSKEAILEAAFMHGTNLGYFAYGMGTIAATLTSFYSWRLVFLTFFGRPRWAGSSHIQHASSSHSDHDHSGHGSQAMPAHASHPSPGVPANDVDQTAGYHPHESPWIMILPLFLLAVGAANAGLAFHDLFIGDHHNHNSFLGHSVVMVGSALSAAHGHEIPALWKWLPLAGMVLGLAVAMQCYLTASSIPQTIARKLPTFYKFIYNKWYFDELYHAIIVRPAIMLGRLFWWSDRTIIDGLGPDGASAAVGLVSRRSKLIQTGYVYHYAFVMLIGIVAALSWMAARMLKP